MTATRHKPLFLSSILHHTLCHLEGLEGLPRCFYWNEKKNLPPPVFFFVFLKTCPQNPPDPPDFFYGLRNRSLKNYFMTLTVIAQNLGGLKTTLKNPPDFL